MNDYIALVLSILAVYRIALMLTTEDGPAGIFSSARDMIFYAFDEDHWITRGVYCPLCAGFWLSLFPPLFFADSISQWIVYALAVAGAQAFLTLLAGVPDNE